MGIGIGYGRCRSICAKKHLSVLSCARLESAKLRFLGGARKR